MSPPHGERAKAEAEADEAAVLDGGVDVRTLARRRGAASSAEPSRGAPSPLSAEQSTEAGLSAGPSAVRRGGEGSSSGVARGGDTLGDSGLHGSVAFFGARHVGTLQKRGVASLSPWKQRWFALHDGSLLYFDRPPELSRPRLAAYVQFSTLRVDEDSLGMSWALGDGSVVQTRACTLKGLRYWAQTCTQLGVAVTAAPPLGRSPSRGVAERPSAAETPDGGGVIRYQKWSISVPAYQARALYTSSYYGCACRGLAHHGYCTRSSRRRPCAISPLPPCYLPTISPRSPQYLPTISTLSPRYLPSISTRSLRTQPRAATASPASRCMRCGGAKRCTPCKRTCYAHATHMPCTCHAHATHMPCTCQGVDDAPLLRVRHPA